MINLSLLKKLREETGISFSLCKKALEEANNDLDNAQKLLSQWGAEKVKDKSQRTTSQGAIFSYLHHNKKIAVLVEILCESDFVANNQEFQQFGQEIAMQIASLTPGNIEELLQQDYIRNPAKKITDLIQDAVLKFGENIKVGRFVRWELGEKL
jgi:elongation factor Ts